MKITGLFNTVNLYNKNTKNNTKVNTNKVKNDSFEVSDKAREFQNVLKAVNASPDVREDKINDIMNKIKNGTYNVSSEDLANKLLSK